LVLGGGGPAPGPPHTPASMAVGPLILAGTTVALTQNGDYQSSPIAPSPLAGTR
jgi:hypothetical protein